MSAVRRRRYPSDTTNTEWALTEPLLPESACETGAGGRPDRHLRREIVDVIRYPRPSPGRIRREMGKGPRAVATVIDSRSVRAAETVGKDSCGYDAGKKINGRRRHMVVDTRGLPLLVMVTPASLTDRDAAKEPLLRLRLMHPEITIVWGQPSPS